MNRQKNVKRTIILKTPTDEKYLTVDQSVTFIKVDDSFLPTSEPKWEEYEVPEIEGLESDQILVPEEKINADTPDRTVVIKYHTKKVENEPSFLEHKKKEVDKEIDCFGVPLKRSEVTQYKHRKEEPEYKKTIPLSPGLSWMSSIPEVKKNMDKLKLIGQMTLDNQCWKTWYYPNRRASYNDQ